MSAIDKYMYMQQLLSRIRHNIDKVVDIIAVPFSVDMGSWEVNGGIEVDRGEEVSFPGQPIVMHGADDTSSLL